MSPSTFVDQLARTGGVFSLLVFIHFASDWLFQSHTEAMAKAKNARIRARHCAVYTLFFLPFLWWTGVSPAWIAGCAVILFVSHFIEDTYAPVYLWMRYIRRPPGMGIRIVRQGSKGYYTTLGPEWLGAMPVQQDVPISSDDLKDPLMEAVRLAESGMPLPEIEDKIRRQEFLKFVETPLGKILLIAVDQIIHIAFLIPIAWVITK
jgi:hypothetical protein